VYEGADGCPVFSFDQFTQFMMQYNYLWGALLIVLGIFLCFFGNKFINVVLFLVVFMSVTLVGGSLFFQYALFKVKAEWAKWLSLAGIVLVAIGLAFLVMKKRKYGIGLIAAWGGVMLGFVITSLFVMKLPGWAFYLILILMAIICFFIAIKIEKMVIIITTAFMGAYAIVRGVSLYAGGFPSEISLHEEI
jgi:LPXTG-motif cell wall-anchored protein